MNLAGLGTKGPGRSAAAAGDGADSRADLPEYIRWQNAMRPEDAGYAEGKQGVPATGATMSHFEAKVRDNLASRLGVVRNKFASDDAGFSAELATLVPELEHFETLLAEMRAKLRRPVLVRLQREPGLLTIAIATLSGAGLMAVLWLDKGSSALVAIVVSVLGAALAALAAYASGLTMRQALAAWQKVLAASALLAMFAGTIAVAYNMKAPGFEPAERAAIGVLISLAIYAVAAASFMMHDSDYAFAEVDRRYRVLKDRVERLTAARAENMIFHTNNARRHVELARQIISNYREANARARPPGNEQPPFFRETPNLTEIGDDWLALAGPTKDAQ